MPKYVKTSDNQLYANVDGYTLQFDDDEWILCSIMFSMLECEAGTTEISEDDMLSLTEGRAVEPALKLIKAIF